MFVRQLIGREAGSIIPLPYHAAQAALDMGTCAPVTDEEIAQAGLDPEPSIVLVKPDEMPEGYRVDVAEGGGYNVIDAGGVNLTPDLEIPNLAAARSFAMEHAGLADDTAESPDDEAVAKPEIPADWRDLPWFKMLHLARAYEPTVNRKDEAIVVLEAAEKAATEAQQG